MIDGVGETRWGLMVVVGGRENCSDLLSEVDYCDLFIILILFFPFLVNLNTFPSEHPRNFRRKSNSRISSLCLSVSQPSCLKAIVPFNHLTYQPSCNLICFHEL